MKTFLIIWLGQFVSRIGTALTRFALLIWLYQQTQSALSVALLGFFAFLPAILELVEVRHRQCRSLRGPCQ